MSRRIGPPGHATVVAYLALFVALGGTGIAVTKITGADIADETIESRHIKKGTITSEDLSPTRVVDAGVAPPGFTGGRFDPRSGVQLSSAVRADGISVRDGQITFNRPGTFFIHAQGVAAVFEPGDADDPFKLESNVGGGIFTGEVAFDRFDPLPLKSPIGVRPRRELADRRGVLTTPLTPSVFTRNRAVFQITGAVTMRSRERLKMRIDVGFGQPGDHPLVPRARIDAVQIWRLR